MLLAEAWEKEFFEVLPIIFLVFEYPDNAILDDVGHNYFFFVWLSTLIVGGKAEMLRAECRNFQFFEENLKIIANFGAK